MPLSAPTARQRLHRREVICEGFAREDGLWDIEGRLVDLKSYEIPNQHRGGSIPVGEPLHDMAIRLTVDLELRIHAVEATIDYAPYRQCPQITEAFQQLQGKRIKPGWTQLTKRLFSGVQGCTHLMELLGPIATTAYQTTYRARAKQASGDPQKPAQKPGIIDTCHALSESGPVVEEFWPEHYRPEHPDSDPT